MYRKLAFTVIPLTACIFLASSAFPESAKEFEPEILPYPDLRPDTLRKYEALQQEYYQLIEKHIPFDSLTDAQKELLENELFYEIGPYGTESPGCSWYCGQEAAPITSTSQLESNATATYTPENIHDFDLRTAWIEGAEGYGIGEEVHITFKLITPIRRVTHIEVYNGYCKSERLWEENTRVKKFALYANDTLVGNLNLVDTYQAQRFEIGSLGGNPEGVLTFTLKILEVYPGTKYPDTAVSEINVDGTGDH